jgi:phospholipid/cholesterol/gamma-HCH transport system ATP-binding protein
MIEVKHVMKSFNGQQVLSDINHQFENGKVNLIIGQRSALLVYMK